MLPEKTFQRTETKAYLIIWILAVLYSIYQFTLACQQYFHKYHDHYGDFTAGWSFLGPRRKDKSDFEWETIHYFLNTFYPVIMFYSLLCEVGRLLQLNTRSLQYFQILCPLLVITYAMGYRIALLALLQPMLFRLVALQQSKALIWICNLMSLAGIALYKRLSANEQFLQSFMAINHFEAYLSILLLCWMNLKCTSFALSVATEAKRGLLDYGAYCLYFPTLFTGPFIGSNDFWNIYNERGFRNLEIRLKMLGFNVLRCVFWMVFADFWLHFIYVNAASFQLDLVAKLDLWSLSGYGYLMGQFFHVKYVTLYGLSTSLASFDNIPVPSLPRCIGRVHLYSDMWKYFDPGLYNFLKTNIFVPSLELGLKKFGASLLCFLFVFVWHGVEQYILIWAVLNFMGVLVESLAAKLNPCSQCLKGIRKVGWRRLKCLAAAPLLVMSAVSNFYFFAGMEVGGVFVVRALSEPLFNKLLVIFVLYCCCQVSTELRDVDAKKM